MGVIERYGIYMANLDPTVGSELKTTRPVLVVSRTEMNSALKTVVICPLTTKLRPTWRTRFNIICAGKKADVALDQIRTIDKSRVGQKKGSLNEIESAQIRLLLSQLYASV